MEYEPTVTALSGSIFIFILYSTVGPFKTISVLVHWIIWSENDQKLKSNINSLGSNVEPN